MYKMEFNYFKKVINTFGDEAKRQNIGIVVVAHALPDAVPYLKAIEISFYVDLVLIKEKSVNKEVLRELKKHYRVDVAKRENCNRAEYILKNINKNRDGYIFIDIGGYFSDVSHILASELGEKFLGCIEDTENGFLKYLSRGIDYPFYQVARSPLKQNEDYLVGQAISFSAETIFRKNGILFNGMNVGVIGYGKIGNGVANALRSKQAVVSVYDIDPIKNTHAYSHGFIPRTKQKLLRTSDAVCLATGTKAITISDFEKIKKGTYLFSVTSSDDSIDLTQLEKIFTKENISDFVTLYKNSKTYFYLLNHGNAVNFIHGTTVGDFILLVQAEIILCSLALANTTTNEGFNLPVKYRQIIAKKWLEQYMPKS